MDARWLWAVGVLVSACAAGSEEPIHVASAQDDDAASGQGARRVEAVPPPGPAGETGGGPEEGPVDEPAPGPVHDPGAVGPSPVGVRTLTLTDPSRGRSFDVELWYPAASGDDGGDNAYEVELFGQSFASLGSMARRGAAPAAEPAPLILFSHGYGGIRFQSPFLTEHLASHGFVVAAPDHPGNTLLEPWTLGDDAAAAQSALDRPLDVIFTLDALLASAAPDIVIDPSRVGVTGHSFGGWTSLEVARIDERFVAAFPLAPGFKETATPDMVAAIGRPLLLFGGSADATTPFDSDQKAAYDLAAPPRYLVRVEEAGHLDFSNLCEVPISMLFVDDGCDPARIEPAEVHARTRALAVAFARVHVAGEPAYDVYLDGEYAASMGSLTWWSDAP